MAGITSVLGNIEKALAKGFQKNSAEEISAAAKSIYKGASTDVRMALKTGNNVEGLISKDIASEFHTGKSLSEYSGSTTAFNNTSNFNSLSESIYNRESDIAMKRLEDSANKIDAKKRKTVNTKPDIDSEYQKKLDALDAKAEASRNKRADLENNFRSELDNLTKNTREKQQDRLDEAFGGISAKKDNWWNDYNARDPKERMKEARAKFGKEEAASGNDFSEKVKKMNEIGTNDYKNMKPTDYRDYVDKLNTKQYGSINSDFEKINAAVKTGDINKDTEKLMGKYKIDREKISSEPDVIKNAQDEALKNVNNDNFGAKMSYYKVPQKAAMFGGTAYLVSAMASTKGQQSNAQLYGQQTPYSG